MSVDQAELRAQQTAERQSHARDVIRDYLSAQANNELLRFITCGSVDDGKSTLIGRLLYEAKCLFEDQVATLERDSERFGTQEGSIDFALLVDGLSAEREQGITIDVAYRFFKTDKRAFIVADTPGHEQYTRNMVTGASTADAAVLLVDARLGVLPQTRRHAYIVSLLRVKRVIVAINKMDLVEYSEARFKEISDEINEVASELGIDSPVIIPVSALRGDCVMRHSEALSWYQGATLMGALESAPTQQQQMMEREDAEGLGPLRMFVQWVNRPHLDFRGVSGTVTRGVVRPGDEVIALPSGERAKISALVTMDGELEEARVGQAITLTFDREIDASRGDLICAGSAPAELTDQVNAHLVWMSADEALSGRSYLLKLGALTLNATLTTIKHSVDIETYREQPATSLKLNDIARVQLRFDRQVPFDAYRHDKALGSFILIDKRTYATVGAGMIEHSLRRATNIHRHSHQVTRARRETLNGHAGFAVWLTGLSGSGKSTLADHLERLLHAQGIHTYLLDGDNVRHGLNHDLGFTPADRVENIRRVSEVAKLMVDAGLVVISAFISPFRVDRDQARARFDEQSFCEVYVNTPLEVAESRDPKGLYRKARAGEIPNFTGIGSPYEEPLNPDVTIDTTDQSPEESARALYEAIKPMLMFNESLSADESDSSI